MMLGRSDDARSLSLYCRESLSVDQCDLVTFGPRHNLPEGLYTLSIALRVPNRFVEVLHAMGIGATSKEPLHICTHVVYATIVLMFLIRLQYWPFLMLGLANLGYLGWLTTHCMAFSKACMSPIKSCCIVFGPFFIMRHAIIQTLRGVEPKSCVRHSLTTCMQFVCNCQTKHAVQLCEDEHNKV